MEFHPNAHECRPNQVDFTIYVSVLDKEGNCVQVIPLTSAGLCYPYDIKDAIEQIVQQINGKIQEG